MQKHHEIRLRIEVNSIFYALFLTFDDSTEKLHVASNHIILFNIFNTL